jgi:hypothetical protein
MGKMIDISSKISNEPTFLHISDTMNYKIDESKNTVFKVMEMWDKDNLTEFQKLDKTIELTLGKEAYEAINDLDLSINGYKTVAMAIMATISGQTLEEFETRFHDGDEGK